MNSIRLKFSRGENVQFISHLDMMKAFERALRRGGLPVAYSKGFNPHPQMVFGLPLSVGVTSEAEYADFDLAEGTDMEKFGPEAFAKGLNKVLPEGLRITAAARKTAGGNIMASIAGAGYSVELYLREALTLAEAEERLVAFMSRDTIIVKKEGKGGIKDMDIKPMIRKIKLLELQERPAAYKEFPSAFVLEALLNAGSASNLKPELLVSAISEYAGIPAAAVRIHRERLYVEKAGELADPMPEGVEI
ncbi:MAG: DUF2344 domain-containing protein [Clostridiales bacterium]|nr:DUF2344 domain-containing protein [Clostridiales bacterium]